MAKETTKEKRKGEGLGEALVIKAPNFGHINIPIIGIAPLCINRFGGRDIDILRQTQEEGARAKNKKVREPKDFEALFHDARHVSEEGWDGIHAASFRNGCISACRVAGFVMTKAKLSIFTEQDGFDRNDGSPLVKIIGGEPEMWIAPVRNSTGVIDLRARPLWRKWGTVVRLRFDADQFSDKDVFNLMMRVGMQVGIGEARPDSKDSAGLGYGLFRLAESLEEFNGFAQEVAA